MELGGRSIGHYAAKWVVPDYMYSGTITIDLVPTAHIAGASICRPEDVPAFVRYPRGGTKLVQKINRCPLQLAVADPQ
jgi:hypothetical protein